MKKMLVAAAVLSTCVYGNPERFRCDDVLVSLQQLIEQAALKLNETNRLLEEASDEFERRRYTRSVSALKVMVGGLQAQSASLEESLRSSEVQEANERAVEERACLLASDIRILGFEPHILEVIRQAGYTTVRSIVFTKEEHFVRDTNGEIARMVKKILQAKGLPGFYSYNQGRPIPISFPAVRVVQP